MASPSRLLHLPFKDPNGIDAHVLVRVSPTSDDSSSPSSRLDLDLLATQGSEAFVATRKLLAYFVCPAPLCFDVDEFLQRHLPSSDVSNVTCSWPCRSGPVNTTWPACRGHFS